jgi:hypothetical protein
MCDVGILAVVLSALTISTLPAPVVRSFNLSRGPQTIHFSFQVRAPAFKAVRIVVPGDTGSML